MNALAQRPATPGPVGSSVPSTRGQAADQTLSETTPYWLSEFADELPCEQQERLRSERPDAAQRSRREVCGDLPWTDQVPESINTRAMTVVPERMQMAGRLFVEAQALVARGERPEALDLLFNTTEDALLGGDIEGARWILAAAVPLVAGPRLPTSAFLTLLVATRPWSSYLSTERRWLADSLKDRCVRENGAEGLALLGRML